MLTQEKERILLKKDSSKYEQYGQSVLQAKGLIQNAVTAYQSLNLPEINLEQLFQLASTSDGLEKNVREHLYSISTAKDLPLKKEAVLPMLELPIGFRNAQDAFATLRNRMETHALRGWFPTFSLSLYNLENGTVSIDEHALEAELESVCCEFLDLPAHVDAYKDAQQVLGLLNDFYEKYGQRLIGNSGSVAIIIPEAYGTGLIFQPEKIRHISTLKMVA